MHRDLQWLMFWDNATGYFHTKKQPKIVTKMPIALDTIINALQLPSQLIISWILPCGSISDRIWSNVSNVRAKCMSISTGNINITAPATVSSVRWWKEIADITMQQKQKRVAYRQKKRGKRSRLMMRASNFVCIVSKLIRVDCSSMNLGISF